MSDNSNLLWMDGEFRELSGPVISVEDRGLQFGDGIYEVIAGFDGEPFLMEAHLDRWDRGAAALRIAPSVSRATRVDVVRELMARCGHVRSMVYGQLTRGVSSRQHGFPASASPTEFWYARRLPEYTAEQYERGVAVITHPDERWARCSIKSTNLLPNCLAKQAAAERGAFEVVFIREDGTVTEGAAVNVYAVANGRVRTHPLTQRILGGVTRQALLPVARDAGVEVLETAFMESELREADEVFITSTTMNIMPVTKVDDRPVGDAAVGPVTLRLMDAFEAIVPRAARRPRSVPAGESVG